MWIWPVLRFWRYSPQGWLCAVMWNCFELAGCCMPFAPQAFGTIIGAKPKKLTGR